MLKEEDIKCNCVVKNREEGESEREWFKRWMCMYHWMQTDYYQFKIMDLSPETAFKGGYHCRWHKEQGEYCFDPIMSPGDPEGAYHAWLLHMKEAR